MVKVEYSSNNSGGSWWLSDEDWYALERAGWDVRWRKDEPDEYKMSSERETGRFLGALATEATKEVERPEDAITDFEYVTGQSASDIGCNCCGPPHLFSYTDESGGYHGAYPAVRETSIKFD